MASGAVVLIALESAANDRAMLPPLVSPIALQRATTIDSHGASVAVIDTLPDDVHVDDDPTTELAWRGPGSLDPFLREVVRRSSAQRMVR